MNEETKFTKYLYNQISFMVAGIALVSSVMFWIMNPQQDMQLQIVKLQTQMESNQTVTAALDKIKQNDLNEIQLRLGQIEDRQIEILKAVARLEAKIK
jgi:preprotein translocase subunit YajC